MKPNQINEQESLSAMRVIVILAIGFIVGVLCAVVYIVPFLAR